MKRFVHSQSEGKKANINKKKKEQNIGHPLTTTDYYITVHINYLLDLNLYTT